MKKLKVTKTFCAGFFLCALVVSSCDNKDKQVNESKEVAAEVNEKKFDSKASEKDAQFIVEAMSASFDEIRLADVALAKSKNAEVKKIAQGLMTDHSAMITELNGVAGQKAITVPAVASTDGSKYATRLMDTDAKEFDKNWLKRVEEMHEASIKKYDDASKNASDANIKNWATTTVEKIRTHLGMIKNAREMMK